MEIWNEIRGTVAQALYGMVASQDQIRKCKTWHTVCIFSFHHTVSMRSITNQLPCSCKNDKTSLCQLVLCYQELSAGDRRIQNVNRSPTKQLESSSLINMSAICMAKITPLKSQILEASLVTLSGSIMTSY